MNGPRYDSNGRLVTYVVLHPESTFQGFWAGLDFFGGRGSTSSIEDVARLIELGCRVTDPDIQAQAEARNQQEAARKAGQEAGRSVLDRIERAPGYDPRHRPGRRRG